MVTSETGGTGTRPGSDAATAEVDAHVWAAWSDAAHDADEPQLALALDSHAAPPPPAQALEHGLRHAVRLLLAGRFTAARAAAKALGQPDRSQRPEVNLVVAATSAACGDQAALERVVGTATDEAPGTPARARALLLAAAAAEALRDVDLAQQAWLAFDEEFPGASWTATARAATARMAIAPRSRRQAQLLGALRRTAVDLAAAEPTTDRALTQRVAADLVERGDANGARMLLAAATATAPLPGLRASLQALDRAADPRRLRSLGLVALTAVAAVVLFPAGVPAAVILLLTLGYPRMTTDESAARRAVRSLVVRPSGEIRTGAAPATRLAALAGGALGLATAILATAPARLLGDAPASAFAQRLGWTLWLTLPIAGAMVVGSAAGALDRRRQRRLHARQVARVLAAWSDPVDCACWCASRLTDDSARAYAAHHLDGAPEATATVRGALGREDVVVRTCPLTGALWLVGEVGTAGKTVALRGLPETAVPAAPAGFYL